MFVLFLNHLMEEEEEEVELEEKATATAEAFPASGK